MKICQRCNLSFDDDNSFCSKCGSQLTALIETMFCPYCGKKVESDMDFCPYCGKNLCNGTPFNNVLPSSVNVQHTKSNNTTIPSPSLNLNNFFTFIKNTSFIKWAIIIFMYVIFLFTYAMTEGAIRTYSMGGGSYGYLTTDSFLLSLLVLALIFVSTWYIVNKLHPKAAKILKFILLYVVAVRVILKLFGVTYGVMIALILVLVSAYYSKRKNED